MYKLIGTPKTRAIRVLWMLEELGLDYELDPVPPHSEAVKAYNPSGKVPVLLDGDDAIIDSVAICQYLADKHGKLTYKAGTVERAQQDSWLHFANDEIDATLWFFAKNHFILPEELRHEAIAKACAYEFNRAMGVLAERLGDGPYVMGEQFTVPDLVLGHVYRWAINMPKWEIPAGKPSDYFKRVVSRPACVKALEIRERY